MSTHLLLGSLLLLGLPLPLGTNTNETSIGTGNTESTESREVLLVRGDLAGLFVGDTGGDGESGGDLGDAFGGLVGTLYGREVREGERGGHIKRRIEGKGKGRSWCRVEGLELIDCRG